ncbi:MaoC family dehydratase [Streptomyces bambusae]|uniref:MaoC family dehydratase n=1 Tax=Streptomyces bambusae TaxID=1550616 RepID=UPI001CFD9E7C|nr:MaoC family dehydratase [Streptomyces bambusae]MCB5164171.1 MaoC family dehydratase [Streptomyces bambusae]
MTRQVPASYVELEPGRFREDEGLHYEDYVVGQVFEHRPGRTITTTDNIWSSLLSLNQHPLHIDEVYASGTPFKKLLVSSLVTFGIVNGMTVKTISQKAVANLGWDGVRLVAPVFVGDTLYAETEILSKRPTASRPGEGIVTVHTVGRNQDGVKVIEFDRTLMASMRTPHGAADSPSRDGKSP